MICHDCEGLLRTTSGDVFFVGFLFGFVNDNNTHISCVPKLECTVQVGRF
jgi:hypothetical protein